MHRKHNQTVALFHNGEREPYAVYEHIKTTVKDGNYIHLIERDRGDIVASFDMRTDTAKVIE